MIGDQLADIVRDEDFAALYEPVGREAISPALLALVTLFQFLEQVPDREAAALVVRRLDWKYALHLPLGYAGFHYSCRCYFRQRLLAHGQVALLFEAVLAKLQALGLIKKRGKQRTDSTAVLGAVRELTRLETVSETLRVAVRALERADARWAERELPASFRERYARRRSDYRLTAEARAAALLEIGQAGCWLLERLAAGPAGLRALEAVGTLQTVWEQRYERVEGQVRPREAGVDCRERIVTPHDPGVRAGQKRGKGWQGDKVHVTETAEADGPKFLTDIWTAPAPSGDAEALPAVQQRLAGRQVLPGQQYVDSGYISGQQLAASAARGIDLRGPPLADTSRQEFKLRDFRIDREAQQAICPGGQAATKWAERTERDGSRAAHIQFPAAVCAACPLRARSTTGQGGRSLSLSEHDERLEARRAEAQTAAFQAEQRTRTGIEATISELVRGHGLRRHPPQAGDPKRAFENHLKGAACNLKRLARALVEWPALVRPALALAGSGQ